MPGTPSPDPARLAAELGALQGGAGLAALSDRSILAVRGTDRASFLQGMLTNEVRALGAGAGSYALLLTEQGKLVAELRALVLGDEVWLDVATMARPRVREALERFLVADDVELVDIEQVGIALRGPRAAVVLAAAARAEVAGFEALAECAHLGLELAGGALRVVRVRDLGVDGFHLWAAAPEVSRAAADALHTAGATAVGPAALEALRVAGGWATEGMDFEPGVLAPEVPSFARAISYRKGCYLGQEVVERVAARGRVHWTFTRLAAEGELVPSRGASVRSADGNEVGRVTSAVGLPDGQGVAMLARMRLAASEIGSGVDVDLDAVRLAARVVGES